jgi:peptidyl-prolyl cis-trans isomerase SurA
MMKKLVLNTLLVLGMACGGTPAAMAQKSGAMGIAAVVNEDAISQTDVDERMKLVMVSSGLPDTKEMRQKVMGQVLDGLIDEQIKIQEAARNNLTVSEQEVQDGIQTIAQRNNLTAEQFAAAIAQQGIPKNSMERQIRAQVAWTKVVQNIVRQQVSVSQNDVVALKARLKENLGKTEYLTAEIFLPVDNEGGEADVRQLANKLVSEMADQKAPFARVAAQVSRAPGAAEKGGDIGWVQEGQLPQELDAVLKTLEKGQISQPIRGAEGYHILTVRDKRTFTAESIPSDDDLTNMIGFERLDRAQQRYLSDLKAAAFIERRS